MRNRIHFDILDLQTFFCSRVAIREITHAILSPFLEPHPHPHLRSCLQRVDVNDARLGGSRTRAPVNCGTVEAYEETSPGNSSEARVVCVACPGHRT